MFELLVGEGLGQLDVAVAAGVDGVGGRAVVRDGMVIWAGFLALDLESGM
jgi:hypothetical protein